MTIILILLSGVLIYAKLSGKLKISWFLAIMPAFLALFLNVFSTGLGAVFGGGSGSGLQKDSCGCLPGQNAVIATKGLFRVKNKREVPCGAALLALQKRKVIQLGCVW